MAEYFGQNMDEILFGDAGGELDQSFNQNFIVNGQDQVTSLANYEEIKGEARATGDEWTKAVSFEIAAWTNQNAGTGTAQGTSAASSNTSTMGGLLETSVTLQEINMKFQVKKGIIEATTSKATSIAGEIGTAAKGR
ncbi:MAG: hypothetical protein VW378_07015 [bacterium]